METIVRSILTTSTKKLDVANRVITFIGTKESPDRTGDIIRVDGWEFTNFKNNPVFLWNHDPSIPPIGRITKIQVVGKEVRFDVEFASKEVNEFADTVFKLFAEGFLSAVSVGFIPKDIEPIFMDGELIGLEILRQELLELSAVAIPAHQDALAASVYAKTFNDYCEKYEKDMQELETQNKAVSLEEYRKTLPPFTNEDEMTEQQLADFEALKTEVKELNTTLNSLITLRESVDLSVKTMETLNKSIVGKLSETPKEPEAKSETPVGSTPQPTLNLEKLMSALGTAVKKIEESQSTFKVEGDK
jgi:HK97 family phage prohead protease